MGSWGLRLRLEVEIGGIGCGLHAARCDSSYVQRRTARASARDRQANLPAALLPSTGFPPPFPLPLLSLSISSPLLSITSNRSHSPRRSNRSLRTPSPPSTLCSLPQLPLPSPLFQAALVAPTVQAAELAHSACKIFWSATQLSLPPLLLDLEQARHQTTPEGVGGAEHTQQMEGEEWGATGFL